MYISINIIIILIIGAYGEEGGRPPDERDRGQAEPDFRSSAAGR